MKIVEAYSDKIVADVFIEELSWQYKKDSNGIMTAVKTPNTISNGKIYTSQYKSDKEMESVILHSKMDIITSNQNLILLIIRHGETNLSIIQRKLSNFDSILYSVYVNKIPFYVYDYKVKIDSKILHKINKVKNLISKIDEDECKTLYLVLKSIVDNYTKTGIISKKDLSWMNEIYNKYKRLENSYE